MKKSGYRIRLEWFVPFDPQDVGDMVVVTQHLDNAKEFSHLTLIPAGAHLVNIQTKYQARREVPDAPKPVEAENALQAIANDPKYTTAEMRQVADEYNRQQQMPPIPAAMRRT